MENPYLELTEELNRSRLRVLLSSGQAVVVHRLAAHRLVTSRAEGVLPFEPSRGDES